MVFKLERDLDLMAAYERAMKSFGKDAPYVSRREIVERAVNSEAARFYVTFEEAQRNLRLLRAGKPLRCKNRFKQMMYCDLLDRFEAFRREHRDLSYNIALMRVLSETKAPRFYMDVNTAMLLIYNMQRREAA